MTPTNQRKPSRPCKSIYGRLRKTTSYSQEQAAELRDLGLRTLQAYEEGQRHPSLITAVQMARLYGCSLSDFEEEISALLDSREKE